MAYQNGAWPSPYGAPVPTLTFNDPNLGPVVESYAYQELSARHQISQAENVALRMDNLALRQKHFDSFQRKVSDAHLKEMLSYDQYSFFEDNGNRPCALIENQAKQAKPVRISDCYVFSAICAVDYVSEALSVDVTFSKPDGSVQSFSVPAEKYSPNALFTEFSKHGGTLAYNPHSGKGHELFYAYISGKLDWNSVYVKNMTGWYSANSKAWEFSPGTMYDLSQPVLHTESLDSSELLLLSLFFTFSLLRGRLSDDMSFGIPFYAISGNEKIPFDVSLNEKPSAFRERLLGAKNKPLIVIEGTTFNSDGNRYKEKENQRILLEMAKQFPDVIFILVSDQPSPFGRENCLPITGFPPKRSAQRIVATSAELVDFVKNNPQVVDCALNRGFQDSLSTTDEEHPARRQIATLGAVSELLIEFFRIQRPDLLCRISSAYRSCLDMCRRAWDCWEDDMIPNKFRSSLFEARHDHVLRFENKDLLTGKFDSGNTALYDDSFIFISTKLLKQIIEKYMPDFTPNKVLQELEATQIISKPCKEYLTLGEGEYIEPRLRKIPRAFCNRLGERDIININ